MEKSVINKTRDLYFDIIKGLAILLVVAGHCIQYGNGLEYMCNKEYFENTFRRPSAARKRLQRFAAPLLPAEGFPDSPRMMP